MTTIRDTLSELGDNANQHVPLILFIIYYDSFIKNIKDVLIEKGFCVEILQGVLLDVNNLPCKTPDLIFLDSDIPETNTFELAHILKSNEITLGTPVILMTDSEFKCKEFLSTADDCITKPLNNDTLLRCINTHLKIHNQNILLQKQAEQLHLANIQLESEIEKRTQIETDLKKAQEELEARVKERITELVLINDHLKSEILERKQAEELLRKRNTELERMERLIVGRELRMIELKNKIRELEARLQK